MPWLFAGAILAAHCHCLIEHASELRAAPACSGFTAPPAFPATPGCENESGCICKGATLAATVDAPPPDLFHFDLHDFLAATWGSVAPDDLPPTGIESPRKPGPCLSAQKLRALFQTYLI